MVPTLNNAQLEIIKLFAADLSAEDLDALRNWLIEFRYHRLQQAVSKLNLSKEEIESWGQAHDRTPYRSFLNKQGAKA